MEDGRIREACEERRKEREENYYKRVEEKGHSYKKKSYIKRGKKDMRSMWKRDTLSGENRGERI